MTVKQFIWGIILLVLALPVKTNASAEVISMPDPTLISDMMNRMETMRERYGLTVYTYNDQLGQAAQDQADWLVETGIRAHIRPDGNAPSDRARTFGYLPVGWCCGENYYMSIDATPDMVWNFWTWSPDHRINLLHPEFTEVGVGMATNGHRHSYVLIFGNSIEQANDPIPEPFIIEQPAPEIVEPETLVAEVETPVIVETAPQPATTSPAAGVSPACAVSHTVRQGENLFRIGLNYGFTASQLATHNGISDVRRVYAGQTLCIPAGGVPIQPLPVEQVAAESGQTASPAPVLDDNWCRPGNPWGDGRCNNPDNRAAEDFMWRCGWYKARGMDVPECG